MERHYYRTVLMIERLHRLFLELVRAELERLGIRDINNVQAMILYAIGDEELSVGELTSRGYYLGSNVSYNLKKMLQAGILAQRRDASDRRTVLIRLTERGRQVRGELTDIFRRHCSALVARQDGALTEAEERLHILERFWEQQLQAVRQQLPGDPTRADGSPAAGEWR